MAKSRRTKRSDGLLQKLFRVNGKAYTVYGHTEAELSEKEKIKKESIEKGIAKHDNPTVSEYYDRWLKGRKDTVSEATIRTQDKFFGIMKNIKINELSMKFGDIKLKEVKIEMGVYLALGIGKIIHRLGKSFPRPVLVLSRHSV